MEVRGKNNHFVTVVLSDADYSLLASLAKLADCSMARVIRLLVRGACELPEEPKEGQSDDSQ